MVDDDEATGAPEVGEGEAVAAGPGGVDYYYYYSDSGCQAGQGVDEGANGSSSSF
jgi:hypothetical protein